MNELIINNITKLYGNKKALDDVSYTFTNGVYGLLGPNGAGKSTLMNVITCNTKANGGNIFFNKQKIAGKNTWYVSQIGYVPQQQRIYDHISLARFMYYMAALKGIEKKTAQVQIIELLRKVNLDSVANKLLGTFSGGMKQRALIAQALLGNPQIIIMDEPMTGLDPMERVAVRNMLHSISKEKIVIISTHIVADIEAIVKEVFFLKEGKNIASFKCVDNKTNIEDLYLHYFERKE